MQRFIVYKHTSLMSGKSYIGWTSNTMEQRWKGHVRDARAGSYLLFHKALLKHGVQDFTHEILEIMSTQRGALKAEQLWIKQLNTLMPGGYNMTAGGDGVRGKSLRRMSETGRANIARASRRRKHTEQTKQLCSALKKAWWASRKQKQVAQ